MKIDSFDAVLHNKQLFYLESIWEMRDAKLYNCQIFKFVMAM